MTDMKSRIFLNTPQDTNKVMDSPIEPNTNQGAIKNVKLEQKVSLWLKLKPKLLQTVKFCMRHFNFIETVFLSLCIGYVIAYFKKDYSLSTVGIGFGIYFLFEQVSSHIKSWFSSIKLR